jgi:hypothetical protein
MPQEWMEQIAEVFQPLVQHVVHDELAKDQSKAKRWMTTKEAEKYVNGTRSLENLRDAGLHRIRNVGQCFYDRIEIDELLESMKH